MYTVVSANRKLLLWHNKTSRESQSRIGKIIPQHFQDPMFPLYFCSAMLSIWFPSPIICLIFSRSLLHLWPLLPFHKQRPAGQQTCSPGMTDGSSSKSCSLCRWRSSNNWLTYSSASLYIIKWFWRVTLSLELPVVCLSFSCSYSSSST